jgi:hypothetical protein
MERDTMDGVLGRTLHRSQLARDLASGLLRVEHPDPEVQAAIEAAMAKDPELIAAVFAAVNCSPVGPAARRWLSTVEAAQQLGISRWTLDVMVARAPKDLPGTPTHVGEGKERRHLRWDGERLHEWAAAYREWETTRRRRR